MKCPACGAAHLVRDTRDVTCTYMGRSTVIPAVAGDFCPACGEVILKQEQGDRYAELVGLFQQQVRGAADLTSGGSQDA